MTSDIEQMSRKVAERMEMRRCDIEPSIRHILDEDCLWAGEPGSDHCALDAFDLADARDRDAAIAWLVAKGWTVRLDHGPDGHTVIIWTDTDLGTRGAYPRPTIEEAFGWAFLAAMEAGR